MRGSLGRHDLGRGVVGLQHLPNLDHLVVREGDARGPFDRLAFDFTWMIQKPASSSFVLGKGPSITVRFPPENLRRVPFELG